MKMFLVVYMIIICTSCKTLSEPPSIEERNEKTRQQMEFIKEKYPEVKNVIGNPNQIYDYFKTVKDAKYAWKTNKQVIFNKAVSSDSKFDGLLINPRDEIDLGQFGIMEIKDINRSDFIINVDMFLYISPIEGTSLYKYEYTYFYKIVKDNNIEAANIYKYIKYLGLLMMNGIEQYVIYNSWE